MDIDIDDVLDVEDDTPSDGEVLGRRGRALSFGSRSNALGVVVLVCAALMAGAAWSLWGPEGDREIAWALASVAGVGALGSLTLFGRGASLVVDREARVLRLGDGGVVEFAAIESVGPFEAHYGGLFQVEQCAALRLRGGRRFLLGTGFLGISTKARARALAEELAVATGAPLVDGKPEKI